MTMGDTSNDNLHHETHKEYALDNRNNALTHIFSSASLQSLVELSSIVLDENLDAYVSLVATSTIKSIIAVAATKSHESSVAQNSTTKCNVIRFPNMQSKDSVSLEQAIEKNILPYWIRRIRFMSS